MRPPGPVRVVETRFNGDVAFALLRDERPGRQNPRLNCWITAVRCGNEYCVTVPGLGTYPVAADNLTDALHWTVTLLGEGAPLTEAGER